MDSLLPQVQSPADLKKLTYQQRLQLADELRQRILTTISKVGGHLGASLGAVELTIALHYVFDTPRDKIVWDVGHQTYAHKLITGRQDRFDTIRQTGGLSGFPKRSESEYDAFGTAHASTALSAAQGFAKSRDLLGEDYHVVAVVGDGAMTGGLAYEGLNNIGHDGTRVLVILNDNSMSIAPNVGALSGHLSRLRTDPKYVRFRDDMARLVRSIPALGPSVANAFERFKDSLKQLVIPGIFFEEMGFTYLGPIDGHDLHAVESALQQAKQLNKPVLIHAVTVKGKGYEPAEGDPYAFHGTGPFKLETGEALKKKAAAPSYSAVFADTLVQLAKQDPRVVAITAAMPDGTGLERFRKVFPRRMFDVGIAEQHAVTYAAGMACSGLRPFVAIYSTFLQRAYDQVIHDVAIQNLPVTFCLDRAGIVGADGETHQGAFDIAYLRAIPNMVVAAPKDENELRHLLKTALVHDGPFAVRYPRDPGFGVELDETLRPIPIGEAELLREGKDVALLAVGHFAYRALEAAEKLSRDGISAAVVNVRYIKPLDRALLKQVLGSVQAAVTIEEGVLAGGFGSAVLELLADAGMTGLRVQRLGLPDAFVEHGDPEHFRAKFGLTVNGIYRAARRALGLRSVGTALKGTGYGA